jgi:Tfp pilus assembly PilM family ATPase
MYTLLMVPTHTFFHSVGEYFPVPDYLNSRAAAISIFQNTITFVSIKQTPAGLIPNPPDIVKLPIGTIENGAIKDSAAVITALKSFQQKHKTRDIFASLPEEYAYIYPITISQYASYDEIVTAVEFSLQEHVPLAPEFLTYDWEIVERSLQGTLLSVVAYDSRIRDAYESLYAEAGYRVRGLEPHICSAARACVSQKMTTGVLLLDIDTTVTTLAVVYKGRALSSSTLQISQRFTDSESASKLTDEKSTDDTDIKDSDIQKSSSDEKKSESNR